MSSQAFRGLESNYNACFHSSLATHIDRIYELLILYGLVTHSRSLFQQHLDLPTGTSYTQCKTPSL